VDDAARSKSYWERSATRNPAWFSATGFTSIDEDFYFSGEADVVDFQNLLGIYVTRNSVLLELGSGAGRMTRRLAGDAARVIAADVSATMLGVAKTNLAGHDNVDYVELAGSGEIPLDDESVDSVISYFTLQHVRTAMIQRRYLAEIVRVLRPGGWAVVQLRRTGARARALEWRGHIGNLLKGRNTLSRSWRGSRVSESDVRSLRRDGVRVDVLRIDARYICAIIRK
jgi:SAM-dependent methyltransferase